LIVTKSTLRAVGWGGIAEDSTVRRRVVCQTRWMV
jgi:hypothetical protein